MLQRMSIACSDLYAILVGGLTSDGFIFFARQGFQTFMHTPIAHGLDKNPGTLYIFRSSLTLHFEPWDLHNQFSFLLLHMDTNLLVRIFAIIFVIIVSTGLLKFCLCGQFAATSLCLSSPRRQPIRLPLDS